jgi:hypothetical protein
MNSGKIFSKKWLNGMTRNKFYKSNSIKYRRTFYIIVTFFLVLIYLLFSFNENRKSKKNNLFNNFNIKQLIKNERNLDNNDCNYIKNLMRNRTQPFDFENELIFFITLLSCKIPFSFIRFGDGEEYIMKVKKIEAKTDKWYWDFKNKKFRKNLIESVSICRYKNNFISIPCKNWIETSRSILSFSKCSNAKYMSFATLFINRNYQIFKNFILNFIQNSNRWRIILVANSFINKNISWAYKYFPVPDHIVENWEKFSVSFLSKLSNEAKQDNLIFFVSAGPAANVIISYLTKINNRNIYIDFGSSIEFITKGYSTRPYSKKNSKYAIQGCESFSFKNKKLIYQR